MTEMLNNCNVIHSFAHPRPPDPRKISFTLVLFVFFGFGVFVTLDFASDESLDSDAKSLTFCMFFAFAPPPDLHHSFHLCIHSALYMCVWLIEMMILVI